MNKEKGADDAQTFLLTHTNRPNNLISVNIKILK